LKAALQVYSRDFDSDFFKLPRDIQNRVESRIDRLSLTLESFPHAHLTGMDCFRLRIGDYRVIYDFDLAKGVLYLLAIGHRREVYKW
jgi:mRNA interferase RelE/StbE